jgi:acetylornithine deacetylase/succinyl-diaminopimelate desuccinylase-like protein
MTRAETIERLEAAFDDGSFLDDLARRVAIRTESQTAGSLPELARYLNDEMRPALESLEYRVEIFDNPVNGAGPLLVGRRREGSGLPTVLTYGHGDVVRGLDDEWTAGLDPWTVTRRGDRIYGRGVADNKGQHSVNLAAIRAVIATRGRLGFNSTVLIETGEEVGSPGLHDFVREHRELLDADVLIASDGPRLSPTRPTLFMGSRGALDLDLEVRLRDGGHHSGNWGGLLANPGVVLAHALASIIDRHGRVLVRDLVPQQLSASVRAALADCVIEPSAGSPDIDPDWGEPGLTAAEQLFGWNTFEVLAFRTGNPDHPVNAIPPTARARCQIRYTVDTDPATFVPAVRRHLDEAGFAEVTVAASPGPASWEATRLDPEHPWVQWVAASVERTTGQPPALLPNLGGSLPNDAFAITLGLPTIWVPHSYASCSQHAPDEHGSAAIIREGLQIMGGIFWDLGDKVPA